MSSSNTHGGARPGSGRPSNDRSVMIGARVSPEAAEKLKKVKNKSEFLDQLIKNSL